MNTDSPKTVSIDKALREVNKIHKQRLGPIGPYIGMLLILLFALALLPLYLFLLLFFNVTYFWIRRQKRFDRMPYFDFDRHNIAHLRTMDKIWCEYCEWSNGSLQWALDITNEIERRYCPFQNQHHPHQVKAKSWRNKFLKYQHEPEDVEHYYEKRYLQESKLDD